MTISSDTLKDKWYQENKEKLLICWYCYRIWLPSKDKIRYCVCGNKIGKKPKQLMKLKPTNKQKREEFENYV